jgi:hypothetical protein
MPVDVVFGLGLAEDDTGGWQALGKFAASPLLDPLHFDVAEMRLAAAIGVQIVYAHRRLSSEKFSICSSPVGVSLGDNLVKRAPG